jgi:hypothetical protein
MSIKEKLSKMSEETVKKSKSKTPVVPGHEALADATLRAYEALKEAEASFRKVEEEMLTVARKLYEDGARGNNFNGAFNFEGVKTEGVQVVFQDRFTQIPEDSEAVLRKAVGKKYPEYFQDKRDIALKDPSDEVIEMLMEKLGDNFDKLFKVKVSITTKPGMDRKQFELCYEARELFNQYKPSVKRR